VNGRYRLATRRFAHWARVRCLIRQGGPARARGALTSKAWTRARARARVILSGALVLAAVSALAACGAAHPPKRMRATLILDFTPNAVHAGIYRALAAGYYKRENIELSVIQPTSTQETLKLIDAGKAQFGLADGSDVAGLIDKGGDAQAVMALVQGPLGGLIALASEHLRSPADLVGKTVGITGVPSDEAVLDTELRHAGVSPKRVKVVTVGFNGGQALVAGRIAAFTGFIPDDGVALSASGHPIAAFALDRNGGPAYPGLVAFTTRKLIASDPGLVKDFVAATAHGYEDTLADPSRSLADLEAANPTLPRKLTAASLGVYLPLFKGDDTVAGGSGAAFGTLRATNVAAMSKWMLGAGLINSPIAPARYGTNRFLP
jgi:putative hydroxymethylpyrimidine transport system substrate-binding protein